MPASPLIYYHNTPEGFASIAGLASLSDINLDAIAIGYGDESELMRASSGARRIVVFLDYVPTQDSMLTAVLDRCEKLIVIDDGSAKQQMADLEASNLCAHKIEYYANGVHSPCVLTWINADKIVKPVPHAVWSPRAVPYFLLYLEDRTMKRFSFPFSKPINAAIHEMSRTVDQFTAAIMNESQMTLIGTLRGHGEMIESYRDHLLEKALEAVVDGQFLGHSAKLVNSPILGEEIAAKLVTPAWIVVVWSRHSHEGYRYELYSGEGGDDVGEIAAHIVGGSGDPIRAVMTSLWRPDELKEV